MAIELTTEEKLIILNQHLKTIDYSIYGLELDIVEAQAIDSPDATHLESLNDRLTDANLKRAALVEERSSLTTN